MPASQHATSLAETLEHWVIGDSIDYLPRIFDDSVTLAIMKRRLSPELETAIAIQMANPRPLEWQWIGEANEAMRTDLMRRLAPMAQSDLLVDDICLLAEAIGYLFDAQQLGVRLRRLETAMCPRFHVDQLGVRFLTTYSGPGTEWLPDFAADRRGLGAPGDEKPEIVRNAQEIQRLAPGDLALLKGSGWIGNAGHGLIHRSPPGRRLMLSIDPR